MGILPRFLILFFTAHRWCAQRIKLSMVKSLGLFRNFIRNFLMMFWSLHREPSTHCIITKSCFKPLLENLVTLSQMSLYSNMQIPFSEEWNQTQIYTWSMKYLKYFPKIKCIKICSSTWGTVRLLNHKFCTLWSFNLKYSCRQIWNMQCILYH